MDGGPHLAMTVIPIDKVVADPNQPRKLFDEERLGSLRDTIQEVCLLNPVHVRANPNGDGTFILVSGERRIRSLRMLDRKEVSAFVLEGTELDALAFALVDNLNREDLSPMELAAALNELWKRGMTMEKIGCLVGWKHRSLVSKMVSLLKLPTEIQQLVDQGHVALNFGSTLAGKYHNSDTCQKVFDEFKESIQGRPSHMTVRRLDAFLKRREMEGKDKRWDDINIGVIRFRQLLNTSNSSAQGLFGHLDELAHQCEGNVEEVRKAWKAMPSNRRKQLLQALRGIAQRSQTIMEVLADE